MHFAYPLPWWLALVLAAAIGGVTFAAYRRPLAPLTPIAARDPGRLPRAGAHDGGPVPVPSDCARAAARRERCPSCRCSSMCSRSMRLNDADGQTRLARAVALLQTDPRAGAVTPVHARALHGRRARRARTPRSAERRRPPERSERGARRDSRSLSRSADRGHRPAVRRRRYRSGCRRPRRRRARRCLRSAWDRPTGSATMRSPP